MRIRVWNAFASNNSGSYVIVGSFPTDALAAEVAAELREVAVAHTAWKLDDEHLLPSPSPLAAYATRLGVAYTDEAYSDDWPQYSQRSAPDVSAVGHQVFLYCDYTVTMPRAIGHAIYARGGRVETELDHAHHPIVATLEFYFPWQTRVELDVPARVQTLVDALCADDGPLVAHREPFQAPAWQGATTERPAAFGESDLVVGVVFAELAAGFAAATAAAATVGASVRVRIAEAHGDRDADALAFLRPCVPATSRALVDLILDDTGSARTGLASPVAELRGTGVAGAQLRIQQLPAVLLEAITPARAEAAAAGLRAEGAAVTIRASAASRS